jgi:hypothetical protein
VAAGVDHTGAAGAVDQPLEAGAGAWPGAVPAGAAGDADAGSEDDAGRKGAYGGSGWVTGVAIVAGGMAGGTVGAGAGDGAVEGGAWKGVALNGVAWNGAGWNGDGWYGAGAGETPNGTTCAGCVSGKRGGMAGDGDGAPGAVGDAFESGFWESMKKLRLVRV